MLNLPTAIDIPLRTDESGTIRVGNTRVSLEAVVADYQRGAAPEEIVHHYTVLRLADVYYVIGYYLEQRAEVEEYLQQQQTHAAQQRQTWEATHPPALTRAMLQIRMK